jgi:hypothetical protein
LLALHTRTLRSASQLQQLHTCACFLCAFPDSAQVANAARNVLSDWSDRVSVLSTEQKAALEHTGMAGTTVRYEFCYAVACQLHDRFAGAIDVDWDSYDEPERLDGVLAHFLGRAEEHAFEEELGEITTQDWIALARGAGQETDLSWLLRHMHSSKKRSANALASYDEAEVPLVWRLGSTTASTTLNTFDTGRSVYRTMMRKPPKRSKSLIAKPLPRIQLLDEEHGQRIIDLSIDALAARQREVFSMTQGNAKEVYLAPLGEGTHAAIMGIKPSHRLHLEGNYGFVLLANGRPVGYGGVSPLFRQGNTGINVFPEYRGGEAAFLFVQLLRSFHTLFGLTRLLANPFQFGRDNNEAIKSGAFWFYYKLGFRPGDPDGVGLAEREHRKILRKRGYRSDPVTLRQLAKSDLHLTLPDAKTNDFFDERWLTTCAVGATSAIASQPGKDRADKIRRLVRRISKLLGVRNLASWRDEWRHSFATLAPTVALVPDLNSWTASEKRSLVALIRSKGADRERDYVLQLGRHDRLRRSLARFCRKCGPPKYKSLYDGIANQDLAPPTES